MLRAFNTVPPRLETAGGEEAGTWDLGRVAEGGTRT